MAAAAIYAAVLLAVVFLLLRAQAAQRDQHAQAAAALLRAQAAQCEQHAEAEARWCEERRELLNRIQRPEAIPLIVPVDFTEPEPVPDGWEEVGRVFEAEEATA